jgi:hypothetical protein
MQRPSIWTALPPRQRGRRPPDPSYRARGTQQPPMGMGSSSAQAAHPACPRRRWRPWQPGRPRSACGSPPGPGWLAPWTRRCPAGKTPPCTAAPRRPSLQDDKDAQVRQMWYYGTSLPGESAGASDTEVQRDKVLHSSSNSRKSTQHRCCSPHEVLSIHNHHCSDWPLQGIVATINSSMALSML